MPRKVAAAEEEEDERPDEDPAPVSSSTAYGHNGPTSPHAADMDDMPSYASDTDADDEDTDVTDTVINTEEETDPCLPQWRRPRTGLGMNFGIFATRAR